MMSYKSEFRIVTGMIWLSVIALWVIAVLWFMETAQAAPFVVADVPTTAADRCSWDGLGGPLVNNVVVDSVRGNPTYGNRICMRDVGTAVVGSNSVTLALRDSTSLWGDSTSVPFSFVRPAQTPPPGAMRLAP